ncbi:OPT oligopeptide transporter [Lentinula edodes]|uniref:OPT oligopeptide transporter n=1 Tax=Lentinula edodes TaxID=5353 RepID=A0A1Q3EGS1_LENED|nr:OPT oligopeptide transporter [Lentinula edodes]
MEGNTQDAIWHVDTIIQTRFRFRKVAAARYMGGIFLRGFRKAPETMTIEAELVPLPTLEKPPRTEFGSTEKSYPPSDKDDAQVADGESEAALDEVIQDAEEVALKVISLQDDPTASAVTARSVFLGIGLSAFSSVLGTIYTFKPQNATVSQLFCLIIAYVLGTAMASIPSHGYWRILNPGPFNIK